MKHLVIPDCQVRGGDDFEFLHHIGRYIVDKQPDKIICIGDFADMPSLSSYDVGKKSFEGKRYVKDVEATKVAMATLLQPLNDYNKQAKKNKQKQYNPELHLTLGNHEHRIDKAVNNDAKLEGVLSISDLGYQDFGWQVYPFLEVKVLDGVAYSHYFTSGLLGRPVTSAAACLSKKHMSCVQGHQQGLQIATGHRADGTRLTSIIAGSCYEHNEDYLGPQGNKHWRGIVVLHNVVDGEFDHMPVSLDFLRKKYAAV
jgi:hypothetical protein